MSDNDISKYFKYPDGTEFDNDYELANIEVNERIVHNTGTVYKKSGEGIYDKETNAQISDATKTSKGIVQVGDGLNVTNGVISTDGSISYNSTQNLTNTQINKALSNLGISHYTGTGGRTYSRQLTFGNTQILYGTSTLFKTESNKKYGNAVYSNPFISVPTTICTGLSSQGDDNATCNIIAENSSPRGDLIGSGSDDNISRGIFIAIGQKFPLVESAKVGGDEDLTESSNWYIDVQKSLIDMSGTYAYFLVDMFMTSDTSSSDYIEYNGNEEYIVCGFKKLANASRYSNGKYTRDYDLDLTFNPDSKHDTVSFGGYSDVSNSRLYTDSAFNTFIMRSLVLAVPVSSINNGVSYYRISFNHSLTNGAKGRIRVFYIPNNS